MQKDQYAGLRLNFLEPEMFDIVQMDTQTGEIKVDKQNSFVAHSLLDAY